MTSSTNSDERQPHSDESERRRYWSEQLEAGYRLVERVLDFPVSESGEPFESLRDAAERAGVEVLYSTSKIAGGLERVFFLRQQVVESVVAVGKAMNERGWILKIEDAFRSLEMQRQLVCKPAVFDAILNKCIWENGGQIPAVELVFRRAMVLVANIPKLGTHMSGSAIDISVFGRDDGQEVWRGNTYLEMSERTPMRSPYVEEASIRNRLTITELLESHGFVHFPFEFWHYNLGDAMGHILRDKAAPAGYGPVNWDPQTNRVSPVDAPLQPLHSLPMIAQEIAAAMDRARALTDN